MDNINYKVKILFLASWYPSEKNPVSGIFIQRHAEAVSNYCDVAVLYIDVEKDLEKSKFNLNVIKGVKTYSLIIPVDFSSGVITRNLKNHICNNFFIRAYKAYRKILQDFGNPDVIHVNVMFTDMTDMGLFAIILRILHNRRYVVTEHSTEFIEPIYSKIKNLKVKLIISLSSKILPVSTLLKNSLKAIKSGSFEVVPNVVDTNFFIPMEKKNKFQKKKILHVSLLDDRQKNVSGLIKVILELKKSRDDFELHIVGTGKDKSFLESLCSDENKRDNIIHFHGTLRINELLKAYQEADLFVMNSNFETFGVVIIEALSCGVPVVSTQCGGPSDIITPKTGIFVEPGNFRQLLEGINIMLDRLDEFDPVVLHEYVHQNFGHTAIGKRLDSIYQNI